MTPFAAAIAVGLALGVVTQLLQGILPGALNWVANSLSGWLVVAFLAGSRMPGWRVAAAACPLLLAAALAGYYATVELRFGYGVGRSTLVFWGAGAIAGGIVFGAAGWWWRHGADRVRGAAAGLLAALFVAEGVYFLAVLPDATVGIGALAIGLVLPALLGRTRRERGWAYLALVPGLLLGAVGYAATLTLQGTLGGA